MAQKFGPRLVELRRVAGLSQGELAAMLGEPQSNISFWERSDKPPRGAILPELAKALNISLDVLLGVSKSNKSKPTVARGRLQRAFAAASKLPRRQQEKIAEFVELFVAQHTKEKE